MPGSRHWSGERRSAGPAPPQPRRRLMLKCRAGRRLSVSPGRPFHQGNRGYIRRRRRQHSRPHDLRRFYRQLNGMTNRQCLDRQVNGGGSSKCSNCCSTVFLLELTGERSRTSSVQRRRWHKSRCGFDHNERGASPRDFTPLVLARVVDYMAWPLIPAPQMLLMKAEASQWIFSSNK